ncbi:MAG TPA: protein kinase [Dictyobacter sp.]|jgi:serine/threonine protein kinase|nr:protein kinase [Dictyobacter sp.]
MMYVCSACGKENQSVARFCHWCGTALSSTSLNETGRLLSGTQFDNGRYVVIKLLGQGGMGAVYKAMDMQEQQRIVAMKEMSQSGLSAQELQEAIASFTHEAELLSRLRHRHLPRVYHQFEEHGRSYLVMDFIEGQTLEAHWKTYEQQGKRMSLARILAIGIQLCSVLDYLHSQQPPIIFRDLKPANIMLTQQGQIYLIDFGIARLFKPGQVRDTIALGSPGYAPPEQYNKATSPQSDIYSLGAVFHQLLTGHDPSLSPFQFKAFSVRQPLLEQLVMKMIETDMACRPPDVRHVRQVLQRVLQAHTQSQGQGPHTGVTSGVGAAAIRSVSLFVLVAQVEQDQRIWTSIHDQLRVSVDGIPNVRIQHSGMFSQQDTRARQAAIDDADLVLVLLSNDFLTSSTCMADVMRVMNDASGSDARILPFLLYPCNWQHTGLSSLPVLNADSIAHASLYAQELRIVAAVKNIRMQLVSRILVGMRAGTTNLLKWLLWQLYGNGGSYCPYFVVGRYMLRCLRSSGQTGMLFRLIDLQTDHTIGEYTLSSHNSTRLAGLLQIIAPTRVAPFEIEGMARQQP